VPQDKEFARDSPLEEDEFELSVPDFEGTFFIGAGAWTCQSPRESEPDFDDRQRQGYRPASQAGPGNDIHAGSPSLQKAPTRGPASLARSFLESSHKLRSIKPAPWNASPSKRQGHGAQHSLPSPQTTNGMAVRPGTPWPGTESSHPSSSSEESRANFVGRQQR